MRVLLERGADPNIRGVCRLFIMFVAVPLNRELVWYILADRGSFIEVWGSPCMNVQLQFCLCNEVYAVTGDYI